MSETLIGVLLGGSLTGLVTLAGLIFNNRHTRRLEAERSARETLERRQDAALHDCGTALVLAAHLQSRLPLMAHRLTDGDDPFDDLLQVQLDWQSCHQRVRLVLPEVAALPHLAEVVGLGVNAVFYQRDLDWADWRKDMTAARDATRVELQMLLRLSERGVEHSTAPSRPSLPPI